MKTLPLLGLFALAMCAAARRRNSRWSKMNQMLEQCDNMNGCNRIPSPRCVMDSDIFTQMITGRDLLALYHIRGFDEDTPIPFSLKTQYAVSGTMIGYATRFRTDVDDDACDADTEETFGSMVGTTEAIFDGTLNFGPPIGVKDSRMYFVSRNPDQYLITFICHDRTDIQEVGRRRVKGVTQTKEICNGNFQVDISVPVGTQEPPNTVDWYKIEKELRKCLGLRLSDTRSIFIPQGASCEDPSFV